ncbi:MAG: transcription antitermination factor NusB [Actinobacteria bacterium]|nr:transcription antitermination factor NusB [Actinomycetota bacterium]
MSKPRTRRVGEDERSTVRERVLNFLYQAESRSIPVSEVIGAEVLAVQDAVAELAKAVEAGREQADELITEFSHSWTLGRMPAIDRNVLRLAIHELVARPEVPTAVVINEAVELAKRFSTEESGKFVNGVLSAIAKKTRG